MVQAQDVEVFLAPFSDITKRYKEYPIPATSPSFTGDVNEAYIEAVDGERFVIVVDLGANFDAKGGTHLRIRCTVDGSSGAKHRIIPTESKPNNRSVNEYYQRRINGNWVKSGYTFVPLQIDETLDMSHDQVVQNVETYGKVVVEIQRSKLVECPEASTLWTADDHVANTRTSSRAVIEDHHVSHSVGHIPLEPPHERFYPTMETERILGEGGDFIKFKIRYRSLGALRMLGIVPKDNAQIGMTAVQDAAPRMTLDQDAARASATSTALPNVNDHIKKRKALEAQLEDIEEEQRTLELEQRKRRVRRELAQLDDVE